MSKVGYCNPPIETRFPVNRQNHTQKHPDGYLTCILKKVLLKQYHCQDPETQKIKKILGTTGLMQVLVWEGMQGNIPAIKEILDRLDGKVMEKIDHSGSVNLFFENLMSKFAATPNRITERLNVPNSKK